ncbi:unnamed protein product, partial [Meganyctiphanes norvegica]
PNINMGKVKRLRQKYHNAAVKEKTETEIDLCSVKFQMPDIVPKLDLTTSSSKAEQSSNIFSGLQISLSKHDQKEEKNKCDHLDTMSICSTATKKREGTKKERRKKRHEEFLQKIDAVRAAEKKVNARKKREKTVIIGDLHPMIEALPTLEELLASANKAKKKKERPVSNKPKGQKKRRQEEKDMISDMAAFLAIHKDVHYQKDPFGIVQSAVSSRVIDENIKRVKTV